jgi:Xaa-Pro aminopeptidase
MKMSLKERERRYKLIRKGMEEQSVDVIVAAAGAGGSGGRLAANFRYLTNLDSQGTYVLFPREGASVVMMGDRFPAEAMKGQDFWVEFETLPTRNYGIAVGEVLKKRGLAKGTIGLSGFEKNQWTVPANISYMFYQGLKESFGNGQFVDATDIILDARTLKSDEEIGAIAKAEELSGRAIEYLCEIVRPGVTRRELSIDLDHFLRQHGADAGSRIGTKISKTPHANDPNPGPMDKPLENGDLIAVNTGVYIDGYAGHDRALISVGHASERIRAMMDAYMEAQRVFLGQFRPGVTAGELTNAIHSTVKKAGFQAGAGAVRDYHPIGLEIPEFWGPKFALKDSHPAYGLNPTGGAGFQIGGAFGYEIAPGMIEAMQIFVGDPESKTLLEQGGTYAVTQDGYRTLSTVPDDQLIEI